MATGEPRLASEKEAGEVRVFDPVAGGEALVVLEVSGIYADSIFGPGDGRAAAR